MACINSSPPWQIVTTLTIITNMKAKLFSDSLADDLSNVIFDIGDSTAPSDTAWETAVSHVGTPVDTADDPTAAIFPALHTNCNNLICLCKRAILTAKSIKSTTTYCETFRDTSVPISPWTLLLTRKRPFITPPSFSNPSTSPDYRLTNFISKLETQSCCWGT